MISRHPRLSYLHKVLTPEFKPFLNSTPTLSLFVPVDDAWFALPELQRLYLESEFASNDMERILNMHTVVDESQQVKWSDSFRKPINCM